MENSIQLFAQQGRKNKSSRFVKSNGDRSQVKITTSWSFNRLGSVVFLCSGFRSPLSPLLSFIKVFLCMWVSLLFVRAQVVSNVTFLMIWLFVPNLSFFWCLRKAMFRYWGFFWASSIIYLNITQTRLFKYTENFTTKNENFQIKNSDIFHFAAQNIDCGYSLEPPRRGGSNEYPHSIFFSRNKKNNAYLCKPQFYYTKVGFKGVKII